MVDPGAGLKKYTISLEHFTVPEKKKSDKEYVKRTEGVQLNKYEKKIEHQNK